jgi:hypothetical protein
MFSYIRIQGNNYYWPSPVRTRSMPDAGKVIPRDVSKIRQV